MDGYEFASAMGKEIKELSAVLHTQFPVPQDGSTQGLMDCMDKILVVDHNVHFVLLTTNINQ